MLSKNYEAQSVEQRLYKEWEEKGLFKCNPESTAEPYTIMIPPPNVTGVLHCGHALTMTIQDTLIRHHRMKGYDVLWQPGTDHASIAVNRIVKMQIEEGGETLEQIGREEFLNRVWKWKDYSGGAIVDQLKRLGASCDWSREKFTMDEDYTKAVNKAFVDLYNKGKIYRKERLVNWDPNYQTSVSDIEVKFKEVEGHLWHFKYPFAEEGFTYNGEDGVHIATTRPETILADGAIAINPEDPRAADLVGRKVVVPIVNREIPIIADPYPDPEFGSGMVKITAAHDFNDYEVYQRHPDAGIPLINLMNPDGTMADVCPEGYRGLDRFDARKKVIADFKELGLFEKEVKHTHQVPHAERDDTVLEPFLTTQWYMDVQGVGKRALDAVKDGTSTFTPKNWEKTYYNWMENLQDWCISRQLWWGHQIPAWYRGDEIHVGMDAPEGEGWTRDEDVLDTWFSSGLWPFATLGWPDETAELKKYYPGSVLVTGFDIIFFWVARMMMMGLEFMDEVPFPDIYMHALVRDEHGKKMSKSFGNVLDPIDLMDKYGTDALRYTLASLAAPGADIRLSEKKVEEGRNFCTKLWNATKYAMMNEVTFDEHFNPNEVKHSLNRWIVNELAETLDKVNKAYDDYRFNDNAQTLYHFTWGTYCDWYLELTKPILWGEDEALKAETRATMGWVLEQLLRMLHPITPFITEEIWSTLTNNVGTSTYLMTSEWPTADAWPRDEKASTEVQWLINIVGTLRNARAESKVPPKAEVTAFTRGAKPEDMERFASYAAFIKNLTKVEGFEHREAAAGNTDVAAVAEGFEMILPLEGVVDFAAEKERIEKEIAKFEAELNKINGMLGNENFVARAPEAVVKEQKDRQEVIMQDLGKLKEVLNAHA